ncbi:Long-chain-fatty-acid--CoA ligase ACSBG2 [Blattella germanica]|nr:Long-chain-fatty-acid--CoA ligase ACSBG2 [Blattella germanica]
MKVNETGEAMVESITTNSHETTTNSHETTTNSHETTSNSHVTTTTLYSKQNGSNGINLPGEVVTSVKTMHQNGPTQTVTKVETITVESNGIAEPKAEVMSITSVDSSEFLNGPDQILPATAISTSEANGRVKLRIEESGEGAKKPISVPGLLHQIAEQYPDQPALASREDGGPWKTITYREYEQQVRTVAKAFLKLGLKRYHSVCILGFNSPEWFISDLAAIYAGGFAAGIYTTNSPEACHYCAERSRANIIVVEDKKQLDKILEIKDRLPELKAIVQYHGKPSAEGVLSWEELMKIGNGESDTQLNNVLKTIAVNECCTLVFTSGTVGNPKAAMLSHDNFTWNGNALYEYIEAKKLKEVIVSYLPLSHVAAQGSLVKTLSEVRPTRFLAVPRVWEKIYEKMQQIGSQSGMVKRAIASWAKGHGLQHYMDKMNGIESNSWSYILARSLVFSRIKNALGLDRCQTFLSGAAPISVDIKKYFMSIDIPVMDAFGMSETTGGHTISHHNAFRLEATGQKRPGIHAKIVNPDEDNQGEELIITAGGENIAPTLIEDEVKAQLPCISNAMLIGDKRKFLSILLTFKTEMNMETGEPLDELTEDAKKWCKEVGFPANTVKEILEGESDKIMAAIQKGIDQANTKAISNAQRVQKFQILPHDFSIPTGEIGPTMKLKRNVVSKIYEDVIERFYKDT